jgi:hypothetical protein
MTSRMPASRVAWAAILAADVAGCSRLMGTDEEGMLRLLSQRRETMDAASPPQPP